MNTKTIKVGFNVLGKNRKRRATFAMRALKREMLKHLRTTDYALDNSVNNFIWARGKAESPTKVEVTIVGDKSLRVFLADSKELKDFLEKGEEKKEVKKETKPDKKEEPKKEVKKEKTKEVKTVEKNYKKELKGIKEKQKV